MAEDHCCGAQFHSPTPLVLHDIHMLKSDRVLKICGTCKDNLMIYMQFEEAHDWSAPWSERRKFGNLIRATGQMIHAERLSDLVSA